MGDVFALLVGIDAYVDPITPLHGCANDVRHLEEYLNARVGQSLSIISLTDAQATRRQIIDGFRTHLAQAGPDDVALFAYSGHGSEEPVPDVIAGSESSGKLQNLVVVDAGREEQGEMVRPIADKELGLLLSEVGARGAHVIALMDCCHSGDVTRDLSTATTRQWLPDNAEATDATTRSVIEFLRSPRPDDGFLPGALERVADHAAPNHVALYACQPTELANENVIGGERRGAFSAALVDVLTTAGPATTYRSLLSAARARIEREYERQHPSLYPDGASGPADAPFLGGTIRSTPPTFSLTKNADGWEVDAGEVHGLSSAVGAEAFRLACSGPDGEIVGDVRVVTVGAGSSSVEPEGWEPRDIAYDAVIVSAPRPLATFHFAAVPHAPPPELADAIRRRLSTCSPDAGPSPFVREQIDGAVRGTIEFGVGYEAGRVDDGSEPLVLIRRADGSVAIRTAPSIPCVDVERAAATVVEHLEHLAKWEQRKESRPHRPSLVDTVQLRLFPREPDETTVPTDRPALVPTGEYVVTTEADGVRRLWAQIENNSEDELYVALLGLTDDLGCSVYLPTRQLVAGSPHNIGLIFELSPGIDIHPDARSQEWLRLVVSETEFDSSDFELDPVGAEPDPADAGPLTRGRVETAAGAPIDAGWWSTTIGLVLCVPGSA